MGALKFPAKSKERQDLVALIVKEGDYEHNKRTVNAKCGIFNVMKKTDKNYMTNKDYLSCLYCKGFVKKRLLAKHATGCRGKPKNVDPYSQREHRTKSKRQFQVDVAPTETKEM